MRQTAGSSVALLLLGALALAQTAPPAGSFTLLSPDGRRAVPTTVVGGQELIALDDVASLFQLTLREDTLAGGMTITVRGRSIIVSANQSIASVDGRVVALPSPVVREGRRWLVPLEFFPRALGPILGQRLELRRAPRLLLVGDVRVPRVVASIDQLGPVTRATIEVTPAAPVATTVEGARVLVRIDADGLDLVLPPMGGGLVEQIRTGDQATSVLVVASGRGGAPRVATTTAGNTAVVTVEVPLAGASAAAPPATGPPVREEGAPVPLAIRRPSLQTIVIDPGHGGDDVGVRGPSGTEEKRITLEVTRRLRALLETRLGVRVIQTRDDDRRVSLDERAAMANNNKADLFLSLHANAAPSGGRAGAEVFHVRLDSEGEAARVAADVLALPVLGGATRRIDVIRWDLAQAAHVDASEILATMIQAELSDRVPMGPRPRQQGPIRVLMGANMPAALVEIVYLTNEEQETMAQSDAFQTSVAQALFDAVVRFGDYLQGRRGR